MPEPSKYQRLFDPNLWHKMAERALDLFESRFLPAVERIAAALERGGVSVQQSAEEVEERNRAVILLRKKIEAARAANDTTGVIDLHAELLNLQGEGNSDEFDQALVQWLMEMIHKRIRTGRIAVEVVVLAGRVADQFGTTKEGASLRASLPTLRRSVGLCARCMVPYRGVEEACDKCMGGAIMASAPTIADLPQDDPSEVRTDIPPPFHEFD